MKDKEIRALIQLLDDPDRTIYQTVSNQLIHMGMDIIPKLERAWEESSDLLAQERLEDIIQGIQFKFVLNGFQSWIDQGAADLLEGAFWVAKYQYPDLELSNLEAELSKISRNIWVELNNKLTALEKIRIINHILFEVQKFSMNRTNMHAPQNSYINLVLEGKKANAVSMSVLYLCLTAELDLPVYPIQFPQGLLLGYFDEYIPQEKMDEHSDECLFYLNPLNRGAVFGKKELDHFIRQTKLTPSDHYFKKEDNAGLIKKLIRTLISDYEKSGFVDKINDLYLLLDAFKEKKEK